MTTFEFDIQGVQGAAREISSTGDDVETAGERTVSQLSTLAEASMKEESKEGVGLPSVHMKDTIRPEMSSDGMKATIRPHKKTREGWLLHHAIVGNPSVPTYGDDPPPVWSDGSGNAAGPIARWAAAKLGDPNDAWAVARSIQQDGHRTFPDRFIDRAYNEWSAKVDGIADDIFEDEVE